MGIDNVCLKKKEKIGRIKDSRLDRGTNKRLHCRGMRSRCRIFFCYIVSMGGWSKNVYIKVHWWKYSRQKERERERERYRKGNRLETGSKDTLKRFKIAFTTSRIAHRAEYKYTLESTDSSSVSHEFLFREKNRLSTSNHPPLFFSLSLSIILLNKQKNQKRDLKVISIILKKKKRRKERCKNLISILNSNLK